MNQIDTVRELANKFVNTSNHVFINSEKIREVAWEVAKVLQEPRGSWGFPGCIPSCNMKMLFLYELIANSVNYCFWYGRHNVRPNGADSTKMYSLLDESFMHLEEVRKIATLDSRQEKEIIIGSFIDKLSTARFPLIDYRVQHLNEVLNRSDLLSVIEEAVQRGSYCADEWLDYLITSFPGYSRDLFLKRAFLFIMQMYRRCGLFKEAMSKILIPADYHIPKMLRWMGCIEYDEALDYAIATSVLIPSGSNVECEIRAATIVACSRIAAAANCTCEEVDTYLFFQRHICTAPFHLTVTTDY